MFDGLFGDETEDASANLSGSGSVRKAGTGFDSVCGPRSVKIDGGTGLVGITNQGATCYLNSLIQTLLFTPELKDAVFKLKDGELGRRGDNGCRIIPIELQMLFANMLLVDKSAVSTTDLTDSFGWRNREEFSQHDVQELNRILFSALEQSLVGLTGSNLVNDLYKGIVVNQIRCCECGNVSEREEQFLDLTVAITGYTDLSDSLTDSYLCSETLSGKNQYKCENCSKLVDAEKGAKLRELPPILTFCLLRLTFDYYKMERQKEICKFTFPQEISMAPFMDNVTSKCTDYELFSVIIHRGGAHGGHYHAIIKDIDGIGHWSTPQQATQTSQQLHSKKEKADCLQFEHPNDLLTYLLCKDSDWITTDVLSQKMQEETGISWNKRFKKRYGTMTKFVKENTDLFSYDESSRKVMSKLREAPAEPAVLPDTEEDVGLAAGEGQEEAEKPVLKDSKAGTERNWFAFDDRRVRPAHKADIERYFGGKECAYMLYYRQKSLDRPVEAYGDPTYLVPQHVLAEIKETNNNLRAQRDAEELRLNTVDIRVYMPTKYTFQDRYVTAKTGHQFFSLTFDRRKTITDLLVDIHSKLPDEEIVGEDLQLYVVKPMHGILHLIENLSDSDSQCEEKVAALNLTGETGFLLVSRSAVEKHQVLCGSQHEPYQITLEYEDRCKVLVLPKSTSMLELSALAASTMEVELPIYLYQMKEHRKYPVELPIHEGQPISEQICDSCVVVVNNKKVTEATLSNKLNVSLHIDIQNVKVQYSMIVGLDDVISSLTEEILEKLRKEYDIPVITSIRLRTLHSNTYGAPLFLDRMIKDCQLTDRCVLQVEEGKPVKSSQMTLFYMLNNGTVHDIVCSRTQTLDKCITDMVANSSPITNKHSKYYLMTVDWLGEPHDVVYNTYQSLAKARIKHGDHLVLVEGIPPPKDAITINIEYLGGMSENDGTPTYEQWLSNSVELSRFQQAGAVQTEDPQMWSVILSSDATIGELKSQLMSMIDIPVLSVDHVRLRAFNGRNPGVIYKSDGKTLKSYKLHGPSARMMVELLPLAESIREDQILLKLREKSGSTNEYGPESPILWDTSTGATARQLRTQVARCVGCEPVQLLLALYEPEKYDWRPINIYVTSSPNRGKKGRRAVKSPEQSLRKAPYCIQDGDLIGYVIIPAPDTGGKPSLTAETFQTEIDQRFKAMCLEKKREQRKAKAEQNDWVSLPDQRGSKKGSTRTEKAITINVGEFK